MRTIRFAPAIMLGALCLFSTGCLMHASTLEPTRYALERELPGARFDPELKLTLGRVTLGMAKKIVRMVEDNDPDLKVLKAIKRVELAIYHTETMPTISPAAFRIPRFAALKRDGWETAVEVVADDGVTWVLFRPGRRTPVAEILVGVLDEDELVLVKVRGDVEMLLEQLRDEEIPGYSRHHPYGPRSASWCAGRYGRSGRERPYFLIF